jgi:hypothetical protein
MRSEVMALLLLTATATSCFAERWRLHAIDDSSRGADGVKLANANGDGLADIATGWEEGGITRVYLHPGAANVTSPWPSVTVGRTPAVEDAVWVDLDGDGGVDVVTCCEGSTRGLFVHWAPEERENLLSAEAWRQEEIPAAKDRMQWMFAQPLDVDGRHGIDLIAGGKGQDAQLGWLESSTDPRRLADWRWHPICAVGWIMSILRCDMDGDGDTDILITDRRGSARGCRWLENPGRGPAQTQPWTSHWVGGRDREVMFATLADLDGDGLQDVLVATKRAEVLCLRRLDSTGRRWAESTVPFPENMGTAKGIAAGDINVDGRIDLVISCEGAVPPKSGVRWLSYDVSPFEGAWQDHEISGPDGIKYDRIELLDLDADGDLDVLTCEERHEDRGLGVIWYENPVLKAGGRRR